MRPQNKNHLTKLITSAIVLIVFLYGLNLSSQVFAAPGINQTINFQGKLVNTDGTNVTDGSYTIDFTLYDAASAGTDVWTEEQTVTVDDGIFRVVLGTVTPFGATVFDNDNLFLGIVIDAGTELSPRIRFTASPYAMNAKKVNGLNVTNTTGTLTIPNSTTIAFSGANNVTFTTTGATGVTLPTTGTLATLAGTEELTNKTIGSTGLTFSGATTDITTVSNENLAIVPNGTGRVGIGLSNPSVFKLEVAGNVGPSVDSTYDLGTTAVRWANGYFDTLYGDGSNLTGVTASGVSFANISTGTNSTATMTLASGSALNLNTGVTLTAASGSTLDVNGDISIADTSIALDGASTNLVATGNFSINTDDLFVEKSSGEVGIGNTAPATSLDVQGAHVSTIGVAQFKGTGQYGYVTLDTTTSGASALSGFIFKNAGTKIGEMSSDNANMYIYNNLFGAGAQPVLTATSNGRVGIGVSSPAATKLHVIDTAEQMRLGYDVSNYTSFTVSSAGDMTVAPTGLDISVTGNVNPTTDSTYSLGTNAIRWSNGYFDTVYGDGSNLTGIGAASIANNSLDYTKFEDTMDLDAALTLNQTTNTWSQTFTGTTTVGQTYTASNLTSGTAKSITSAATAFTGSLMNISLTSSNVANTGTLLKVATAATNTGTVAMFNNLGTGNSFRVNDETGDADTTPFVIDATGAVGIGVTTPGAKLDVDGDIIVRGTTVDGYNLIRTEGGGVLSLHGGTDCCDGAVINVSSTGVAGQVDAGDIMIRTGESDSEILFQNSSFDTTNIIDAAGNFSLANQADLILADADSTASVGIQSAAIMGSSYTLTLPDAVAGGSNYALVGNASGVLTWLDTATLGTGDITAVGSMVTSAAFANTGADDDWLGLGATNGRIEFDDQTTDEVNILAAVLGVGTSTPASNIESLSTTEQLRLSYDGSNRTTFTVSSGGDLTIAPSGSDTNLTGTLTTSSNLTISNQGDLRLAESGGANYFGLQAAAAMDSDDIYTWPSDFPAGSGYALTSSTTGVLGWTSVAGSTGDITDVGSMTAGIAFGDSTADDDWLGLGAAAGRIEFDDQTIDEIIFSDAYVGIGTTAPGSALDIIADKSTAASFNTGTSIQGTQSGSSASYSSYAMLYASATSAVTGGNTAEAFAFYNDSFTTNDAEIQNIYGNFSQVTTHANDTGYAFYAKSRGQGTSTGGTQYGIYIDMFDTDVTQYGIYSNNSSSYNVFEGNVGIGTDATPNYPLEIVSTATSQMVLANVDTSQEATFGVDTSGNLAIGTNGTTGLISMQADGAATISRVQIGAGGAGSTTPDYFGLDVKSDTGDPAGGAEGYMYYNTFDNKFRCYQGAAWTDCIGTGGGGITASSSDVLTNKSIGSTGLVFNGATSDITTISGEDLTIVPGGTGDTVISVDADTNFRIVSTAAQGVDLATISNSGFGTTTSGVDGMEIEFTQADDADATDGNAALRLTVTNSSGDADSLYGLFVPGITGAAATEYALVIGAGWDRGLDVASAANISSTLTATGTTTIGSAGNTFTFNPASGPVYAGTARPAKTITLNPEFPGAVLTAFYGAGTDTLLTGSMTSDADSAANLLRNYYSWNSSEVALNYYTVAVRVKLPKDFGGWATSNAVQVDFATESTSAANNLVDVRIYNADDTPGTVVNASTSNVSGVANTWTTITIDDSSIDDGGAPDWDAADESAVIYIRMGSLSDNLVKIGDIRLNYLSTF